MKRVYVAHPYSGLEENKQKVEELIKRLVKMYDDIVFYSPIHSFGYLYESTEYIQGMNMCLNLLKACDELWLCGDWENSTGCMMEYSYAIATNGRIKIEYIK